MKYSNDYFSEDTQTKFNASLKSLERLHDLLVECNQYSRKAMVEYNPYYLSIWKTTLSSVYQEIMPNLNQKEFESKDEEIKQMYKEINNIKGTMIKKRKESGEVETIINKPVFDKIWNKLYNVEFLLRKVATDKGMLLIKGGDSRWAMAD